MFTFIIGFIFALGLGISGMTQPGRVIGFLDLFGNWDPSLLFVMVGALLVHATLYRVITKRKSPLFGESFQIPTTKSIDRRLLVGAMIFGIGWGLGGFCPAPAMTALASLQLAPLIFVASMVVGMIVQKRNRTIL